MIGYMCVLGVMCVCYKWVMIRQSMCFVYGPLGAILVKSGNILSGPLPMCIPQSNMILFPPNSTMTQLPPTSCPAPRGRTRIILERNGVVSSFSFFFFF